MSMGGGIGLDDGAGMVSMTDVMIVGALEGWKVVELLMIGDFMSLSIIEESVVDDDVILTSMDGMVMGVGLGLGKIKTGGLGKIGIGFRKVADGVNFFLGFLFLGEGGGMDDSSRGSGLGASDLTRAAVGSAGLGAGDLTS